MDSFLHQYLQFSEQLVIKVHDRFFLEPQTNAPPAAGNIAIDALAEAATSPTDDSPAGTLLQRPAISSFFSAEGPHAFLWVIYFPILILVSIWLYLGLGFFAQRFSAIKIADFICERTHLLILSLGAFSTFLQFFLWRPDMPHFSEFMPGFMILLAYFLFLLGQRDNAREGMVTVPRPAFYVLCLLSAIFLIAFVSVYEEGLIIRKNRDTQLQMEKGIDVWVSSDEYNLITRVVALVKENSKPDEFVLCFPYCPGINFIADRPTFLHSFYIDDSAVKSGPSELQHMRQEIAIKKPKVIVITDWAINGTEISRFRNWARPLYNTIKQTYRLQDTIKEYEIYVLR